MKIALLYAMERELESLLGRDGVRMLPPQAGVSFYQITPDIVACAGGIGKVNCAMAAQLLIDRFQPDLILNAGVAGAMKNYDVGTIALVRGFVQHDVDTSAIGDPVGLVPTVDRTMFFCDELETADRILTGMGVAHVTAKVATGDWFATNCHRARQIWERFAPDLCEMEGCAAAQVCLRNGVRFLSLKTVSDRLFTPSQTEEYFDFPKAMARLNEIVLPFAKRLLEVL